MKSLIFTNQKWVSVSLNNFDAPLYVFLLFDLDYEWSYAKPSLKIRTANAICWNCHGLYRDYSLDHVFFRNNTFLFLKVENWKSQHLLVKQFLWDLKKFQLLHLVQKMLLHFFCEFKFCEVSRNNVSIRCWKFQLSILKNKSFLPTRI